MPIFVDKKSGDLMAAARGPEHTEQPLPEPGKFDVTQYILDELEQLKSSTTLCKVPGIIQQLQDMVLERRLKGIATYGRSLETHNGRDAHRDELEELVDMFQYRVQAAKERKDLEASLANTQATVRQLEADLGEAHEQKTQAFAQMHEAERKLRQNDQGTLMVEFNRLQAKLRGYEMKQGAELRMGGSQVGLPKLYEAKDVVYLTHKDSDGLSAAITELCKLAYDNSAAHGFWDKDEGLPTKLALMHSELSEALEAFRDPSVSQMLYYKVDAHSGVKISKPEGVAAELADCMIRIFDCAGYYKMPLAEAVLRKMEYNAARPHMHGKKL